MGMARQLRFYFNADWRYEVESGTLPLDAIEKDLSALCRSGR